MCRGQDADLLAVGSNDPDGFFFDVDGFIEGEGSPVMLFAPVYLPNGTTITTSGVDPDLQALSAPDIYQPMVTLPENAYYVPTCLPSASTALISARIYYVASDLVFADGFEAGGTSSWSEVTP